jgi:flavin-dependent dehydrogenase
VGFYAGRTMMTAPLPSGGGRALGRETLDTLLRDAAVAAGATLFQPADILSTRRIGNKHQVQLADTLLEAPILIAACGSWNRKDIFNPLCLRWPEGQLRHLPLSGASRQRGSRACASDLLAFKAYFHNSKLPAGLMPLLAFPGGYGGMVHQEAMSSEEGGRISLSCCIRRDALAAARARHGGRAADAVFAHIKATTRGAAEALQGAQAEGAFLAAGPIRPGLRARYRDGIFFTGNLAGEAHPVIAEGISMAVQASTLLVQSLLAEPDTARAGARYAAAWRRAFAPRLYTSAAIAWLAMHAGPRDFSAFAVRQFPRLLTFGAGLAGKAM